jgi:ubiquinone/menaquinone biosynthesis C-methylase UbiE
MVSAGAGYYFKHIVAAAKNFVAKYDRLQRIASFGFDEYRIGSNTRINEHGAHYFCLNITCGSPPAGWQITRIHQELTG